MKYLIMQILGEHLGIQFDVDIIETNLKIIDSLMPDTTVNSKLN